jgi:hypothetical protein
MLSGRTIATITVAALTMYPLETLPSDVYVRDGEKVAEVAREVPVAARTIEGGASAPNDGRPSVLSPAIDPGAGPTVFLCLTEETIMLASSTIGCS